MPQGVWQDCLVSLWGNVEHKDALAADGTYHDTAPTCQNPHLNPVKVLLPAQKHILTDILSHNILMLLSCVYHVQWTHSWFEHWNEFSHLQGRYCRMTVTHFTCPGVSFSFCCNCVCDGLRTAAITSVLSQSTSIPLKVTQRPTETLIWSDKWLLSLTEYPFQSLPGWLSKPVLRNYNINL